MTESQGNPFSASFSFQEFYTGSTDAHHHSAPITVRVPANWTHYLGIVAGSPKIPEYKTVSDVVRDCIAKGVRAALEIVEDSNISAGWNTELGLLEREAQESRDFADMKLSEKWRDQLRDNHGWTPEQFWRDREAMRNPRAIREMDGLATHFDIPR